MRIPEIQPFQFIRGTAFSERVQLANKINEIIDGINSIGEIPDLQAEIDNIKGTISQIQTAIADTDSDVSTLSNQVNTLISEVNGLLKEVVSEVALDSPGYGQVRVKLIHEDETETASNVLQIPVIQDGGITLISGTTDRSFKIQYVTTDGVTHTTNDFVIPEGGGTDVTVTSVSIEQGDTSNSFKFEIGLSDGSSIQSNSYPFPPGTELTPATTSQLGGIKVGTHLSVTADGTLSVDMTTIGTAAAAPTVMWTADTSKVTLHFDSLLGTEYTEDIPTAASGGAGTIDAAAYQKLQSVPAPDTIATDAEISDLQEQITDLKLLESGTNGIELNESSVNAVRSVSGTVNSSNELVITVNGVTGQVTLPESSAVAINRYTNWSDFFTDYMQSQKKYLAYLYMSKSVTEQLWLILAGSTNTAQPNGHGQYKTNNNPFTTIPAIGISQATNTTFVINLSRSSNTSLQIVPTEWSTCRITVIGDP